MWRRCDKKAKPWRLREKKEFGRLGLKVVSVVAGKERRKEEKGQSQRNLVRVLGTLGQAEKDE
jgi:hypothetical protein